MLQFLILHLKFIWFLVSWFLTTGLNVSSLYLDYKLSLSDWTFFDFFVIWNLPEAGLRRKLRLQIGNTGKKTYISSRSDLFFVFVSSKGATTAGVPKTFQDGPGHEEYWKRRQRQPSPPQREGRFGHYLLSLPGLCAPLQVGFICKWFHDAISYSCNQYLSRKSWDRVKVDPFLSIAKARLGSWLSRFWYIQVEPRNHPFF